MTINVFFPFSDSHPLLATTLSGEEVRLELGGCGSSFCDVVVGREALTCNLLLVLLGDVGNGPGTLAARRMSRAIGNAWNVFFTVTFLFSFFPAPC